MKICFQHGYEACIPVHNQGLKSKSQHVPHHLNITVSPSNQKYCYSWLPWNFCNKEGTIQYRDNREKRDVVLLSLCSLTSRPCNLKPPAPLHCNPVCTSSLSLARHKTHKLAPAKNQSINQSVRGSLLIDIQKFNELESRMNSLTAHINNQPSPGSNWYWYIFTDSTVRFRHQKAESRDIRWQITKNQKAGRRHREKRSDCNSCIPSYAMHFGISCGITHIFSFK